MKLPFFQRNAAAFDLQQSKCKSSFANGTEYDDGEESWSLICAEPKKPNFHWFAKIFGKENSRKPVSNSCALLKCSHLDRRLSGFNFATHRHLVSELDSKSSEKPLLHAGKCELKEKCNLLMGFRNNQISVNLFCKIQMGFYYSSRITLLLITVD